MISTLAIDCLSHPDFSRESLRHSHFAVMRLVCSTDRKQNINTIRKECCSDVSSRFFGGSVAWHPKKRLRRRLPLHQPQVFWRKKVLLRTWVWRKFAEENRVNFQRGDWTGVKWSSQSRKRNFLTLRDLAFGFVHKRSGDEIRHMQNPVSGLARYSGEHELEKHDSVAWGGLTRSLLGSWRGIPGC